MLALIVASAIVARDRHRAETLFYVWSTVATFMSAEVLIGQIDAFKGIVPAAGSAAAASFVAMAALATLANGAIIILAVERYLSRRNTENSALRPLILRPVFASFGLAIAVAATRSLAPSSVQAATALGFAAIFFIAIVRRLGVQSWPSVLLFLIFAGIAAAGAISRLEDTSQTGLARLAASSTAEALALAGRAMAGTPWLGNGAGTFRSLAPIYQDFGTAPALEPPSTAIAVAIEWGAVALAITILFAVQFFVFTFRGAVRRGRDSFFASTTAAGVLVMLGEAFCDPSLLNTTVQIAASVLVGLGLSQSVGRTTGLK
jgi:hypothetical protein